MLVLEAGMPPAYVMDEMPFYEINIVLEGINLRYRNSWEQARFISYIIAQVNSKNTLRPTDILLFDWDHKESKEIDKGEADRLLEKQKLIIDQYNGGES